MFVADETKWGYLPVWKHLIDQRLSSTGAIYAENLRERRYSA